MLRRALTGIEAILVAVGCAALILATAIPALTGWVPLTVVTGSMSPAMPAGSLVVVAPVDGARARALDPGTVVAYLPEPDSDEIVTHRILTRSTASDGSTRYVLAGDANDEADPVPVVPEQIRGVRRYWVPGLGYAVSLVPPAAKGVARWALVGGLVAYALWQIAMIARDRDARRGRPGR
ncbi:signal peptidase I [Actinomyces sp. B33]|uniref:signal peptidase I n=1 Tax=Actinomyces sp. B33 TaxID=2942131 RepID=UPI002341E18A|nr:signal peptidase I [Actinomyces sp. B33]MDC4232458.1 signal peptidase I [Actinomyces sp. B33]